MRPLNRHKTFERPVGKRGLRAVCVRETQLSLRESSKRLIEDKIQKFGLGGQFEVFRNEILTPEDGVIIFRGMQSYNAESIKSLEAFDIVWVEEAQSLSPHSLDLLRPTMRAEGAELWFSWNPRTAKDPVDKLFRGSDELPPRTAIVKVNWPENPFFTGTSREEMEYDRRRDPDKYAHIWLGEYEQRSDARVFHNWTIGSPDIPVGARPYFGADWGFSIDPTVLVRCWVWDRTLYVDRELYRIGCELDHTPALFDKMNDERIPNIREWPIIADSSDPQNNSYMRRHGYPKIEPSIKGPNSVEQGVEFLKNHDIVVHPDCRHTIDELTMYSYKIDKKTDEILPELGDKKNHVIDAVRYAVEKLRRSPPLKFVVPFAASQARGFPG